MKIQFVTWVVGLLVCGVHCAVGQVVFETRASSGEFAPGTVETFTSFSSSPAINASGRVAFNASLTGSTFYDVGVWSDAGGALALIARENFSAPDPDDEFAVFNGFADPRLNDAGDIAFRGFIYIYQGIYSDAGGTLEWLARTDHEASDVGAGVNFSSIMDPVFNGSGQAAFSAMLTGTGVGSTNNQGIWAESGVTLGLVARTGDAAPGGGGAVFSFISPPTFNDAGQTAFFASLTGAGVGGTNDSGVWSEGSGAMALVARKGDPAPGTAAGVVFNGFFPPSLNAAGKVAFTGILTGTGVTGANDWGIWSDAGGSLELVIREGDPAPGIGGGVVLSSVDEVFINGMGHVVFLSGLSGPGVGATNNLGLWAGAIGAIDLVVRTGDSAPGAGEGVVFSGFPYGGYAFNGTDQVAFGAALSGAGVDASNDRALWVGTPGGIPQMILREGDLFGTNIVGSFIYATRSAGEDGRRRALNDAGQFAFRLGFTNGSQAIVVASLDTATASPLLEIIPASPGMATLSWTPPSTNWVLQERQSLTSGSWTNSVSGSTNPVVVPATLPAKFFRLFKP